MVTLTTRLFKNGNSQVVRIPQEFHLEGTDVEISKSENGDLIIRSLPINRGEALLSALQDFDEDFAEQSEKNQNQQVPLQNRSKETNTEVDAYLKRHGIRKAYLIEAALQHHLQALREIPEDLIIPSRLVLTGEAMAEIAERIIQDEPPTESLNALFLDSLNA